MSIYTNGPQRQELINRLRHESGLTKDDVDDAGLLSFMHGTFLLARIELGMSLNGFKKEVLAALPKWLTRRLT